MIAEVLSLIFLISLFDVIKSVANYEGFHASAKLVWRSWYGEAGMEVVSSIPCLCWTTCWITVT